MIREGSIFSCAALTLALLCPATAAAQIVSFVFTSDLQTIQTGAASEQLTVQAQGAGGASVNIPLTGCLSLTTPSPQGQFSSNATNWNAVSVLTMNKNTANKNFYYKDGGTGTPTLTVKIALKPESESRSCANWPFEEWNVQWTATQSIQVGATSSGGSNGSTVATSSGQTTQTTASGSAVPSYVAPPETELFASGGEDRVVIVGADTEFRGRAYNRKKEIVDQVRFVWNFGDGSTAEGQRVLHHYEYPGKYAVVLTIAEGTNSADDRIVVTAEPARLAFSVLSDGSVAIENKASRDLDLSRWIVRQLNRDFFLPDDSILLAGSSMRIPQKTLGFWGDSSAELAYPNGVVAVRAGEHTGDTLAPTSVPAPTPAISSAPAVSVAVAHETSVAETEAIEPDEPLDTSTSDIAETSAQAASAAKTVSGTSYTWLLGALGIAALAAGAVVVARRFGKREWDIIEESDTSV